MLFRSGKPVDETADTLSETPSMAWPMAAGAAETMVVEPDPAGSEDPMGLAAVPTAKPMARSTGLSITRTVADQRPMLLSPPRPQTTMAMEKLKMAASAAQPRVISIVSSTFEPSQLT